MVRPGVMLDVAVTVYEDDITRDSLGTVVRDVDVGGRVGVHGGVAM